MIHLLKEHGFPEINSHLTAEQAGKIAKQANVKGLALTHFWLEEDLEKYVKEAKGVFNNVIALKEGQIIDIPVTQKEEHENIKELKYNKKEKNQKI